MRTPALHLAGFSDEDLGWIVLGLRHSAGDVSIAAGQPAGAAAVASEVGAALAEIVVDELTRRARLQERST